MKNISCVVLYPALLVSFLVSGCKTAEFRSTPGTRVAPAKDAEIVATPVPVPMPTPETTPTPDPIPERVALPDPITETTLNPEAGELGLAPRERSETFRQESTPGTADILVVIDDSNSMAEEQKNLSSKMNSLLQSLAETDWQIGVVTTSPERNSACRLKLVRSTDADAPEKFRKAVEAGTGGTGNEQGILQAVIGLKCPEQPWVREKSTVAVLIVSDEDNCSNGTGCRNAPGSSEAYLIDYVEKDLGRMIGLNAGFYGIYSPPGDECRTAPAPAQIYQRLIDYRVKDRKNFGNICDASYQGTLERISKNIASLLKKTFELKEAPIVGSVRIEGKKTNGQAISPDDFELMGRVIGFKVGREPMKNSEIKVFYQVPGQL